MTKYSTFHTFLVEHQWAGKKRNGVSLPRVGARTLSARQPGSFLNRTQGLKVWSSPERVLDNSQRTRLSRRRMKWFLTPPLPSPSLPSPPSPPLKNWPVKGLCGWCFICLRPPPLLWPKPPPFKPFYVYTLYLFTQGRGGGREQTREKVRGALVHKAGSIIHNMTDSISSL